MNSLLLGISAALLCVALNSHPIIAARPKNPITYDGTVYYDAEENFYNESEDSRSSSELDNAPKRNLGFQPIQNPTYDDIPIDIQELIKKNIGEGDMTETIHASPAYKILHSACSPDFALKLIQHRYGISSKPNIHIRSILKQPLECLTRVKRAMEFRHPFNWAVRDRFKVSKLRIMIDLRPEELEELFKSLDVIRDWPADFYFSNTFQKIELNAVIKIFKELPLISLRNYWTDAKTNAAELLKLVSLIRESKTLKTFEYLEEVHWLDDSHRDFFIDLITRSTTIENLKLINFPFPPHALQQILKMPKLKSLEMVISVLSRADASKFPILREMLPRTTALQSLSIWRDEFDMPQLREIIEIIAGLKRGFKLNVSYRESNHADYETLKEYASLKNVEITNFS